MDDSIPIHIHNLNQIEPGNRITLSAARDGDGNEDRTGVVTEAVSDESTATPLIIGFESEEGKLVEVKIDETVGESSVRERQTDEEQWGELGPPIRVGVYDADSKTEVLGLSYYEMMHREFDSIVAAAQIEWNSRILKSWPETALNAH